MFRERDIIYFDPFYFKNGNTSKAKYFLVLKVGDNGNILATLPTSKNTIPHYEMIENGCLELPDINLNTYIISTQTEVTE